LVSGTSVDFTAASLMHVGLKAAQACYLSATAARHCSPELFELLLTLSSTHHELCIDEMDDKV